MPISIVCHFCGASGRKKPTDARRRNGRRWKHTFCDDRCYAGWRRARHNEFVRTRKALERVVWGTTEAGRMEPQKAKPHGRRAEILARDKILPALGFTEIVDLSGYSNQFFIDFVATYKRRRVLVDATIKMNAHIPDKAKLAEALRMPFYMLHVAIASDDVYWLNHIDGVRLRRTSKVPAAYLNKLTAERFGTGRLHWKADRTLIRK